MFRSIRSTALFAAACSVTATLLFAPSATAASPNNITSTTFAGMIVSAAGPTTTQATVQVPNSGKCFAQGYNSSVGAGAILNGSTGVIGAAAYTVCQGGVLTTQMIEYNYNQWAYLGPPNMLSPGESVTINIQPNGTNYSAAIHMSSGVAYVSGPIGNPSTYDVGIWPRKPEGGASSLNDFGTLYFSSVKPGFGTAVDLVAPSGLPRAITGRIACGKGAIGCNFPVTYSHH